MCQWRRIDSTQLKRCAWLFVLAMMKPITITQSLILLTLTSKSSWMTYVPMNLLLCAFWCINLQYLPTKKVDRDFPKCQLYKVCSCLFFDCIHALAKILCSTVPYYCRCGCVIYSAKILQHNACNVPLCKSYCVLTNCCDRVIGAAITSMIIFRTMYTFPWLCLKDDVLYSAPAEVQSVEFPRI